MLGKMPKLGASKTKMKMVNESDFDEFISRISKTLYYGDKFKEEDHLSYPVIELAAEIYSDLKTGKSIDQLYRYEAMEMTQNVQVNPCYMVLALLYIERLKDCNPQYLDNVAPSQLFLISLVLASKFHEDSEFELSLSMFDKFASFSRTDLFDLELSFLSALQWNVHVTQEEFDAKLGEMERLLALKLGGKRNWFTYTEMHSLLDEAWLSQITNLLITVSAVCLTTYTAGVVTLLASSTLATHLSSSAALAILAQLSLLIPSPTTPTAPANGSAPFHATLPGELTSEEGRLEEELDALVDGRIEEVMRRLNEMSDGREAIGDTWNGGGSWDTRVNWNSGNSWLTGKTDDTRDVVREWNYWRGLDKQPDCDGLNGFVKNGNNHHNIENKFKSDEFSYTNTPNPECNGNNGRIDLESQVSALYTIFSLVHNIPCLLRNSGFGCNGENGEVLKGDSDFGCNMEVPEVVRGQCHLKNGSLYTRKLTEGLYSTVGEVRSHHASSHDTPSARLEAPSARLEAPSARLNAPSKQLETGPTSLTPSSKPITATSTPFSYIPFSLDSLTFPFISVTSFPLFEYFPNLKNISSVFSTTNIWTSSDNGLSEPATGIDSQDRYLTGIDRNAYRMLHEKINLKF